MQARNWLIEKRGKMTQTQVAKLCDISRGAYSNIENGRRGLSVNTAKKIAKVLKFDWKIFFEQKRFELNQNQPA